MVCRTSTYLHALSPYTQCAIAVLRQMVWQYVMVAAAADTVVVADAAGVAVADIGSAANQWQKLNVNPNTQRRDGVAWTLTQRVNV